MYRKVNVYSETGKTYNYRIEKDGTIEQGLCGTCCAKEGITNPSYAKRKGLFLKYEDGKVFCPRCGAEYKVIKTPEEYEAEKKAREEKIRAEALENLHVGFAGKDMSTGISFYSLSARVDSEIWDKIKGYFSYYRAGWSNGSDMDFEMYGFEPSGWLTTEPEKVETILVELGVMKAENTLKAKREAEEEKRAEAKAEAEAEAKLKSEIDSEFENKIDKSYYDDLQKFNEKKEEQAKIKREVEREFYNPRSEKVEEINDKIIEEIKDNEHTYLVSENNLYLVSSVKVFSYEDQKIYKLPYSEELLQKIREMTKEIEEIGEPKIVKNETLEKPQIDEYPHTIEEYGDEVVERYEDPNYRFNLYGGGHEYVICKKHIWKIRNNGSDGADWSQNNIATGGAGAIGVRVPYTDELATKIRKYCKTEV